MRAYESIKTKEDFIMSTPDIYVPTKADYQRGQQSPFSASRTETSGKSEKFVNSAWTEMASQDARTEAEEKKLSEEYRAGLLNFAKESFNEFGVETSGEDSTMTFEEFAKTIVPKEAYRAAGMSNKQIQKAYKDMAQAFKESFDLDNDGKLDVKEFAAWCATLDEKDGKYDGTIVISDLNANELANLMYDTNAQNEFRTRLVNAYNQFIAEQE